MNRNVLRILCRIYRLKSESNTGTIGFSAMRELMYCALTTAIPSNLVNMLSSGETIYSAAVGSSPGHIAGVV